MARSGHLNRSGNFASAVLLHERFEDVENLLLLVGNGDRHTDCEGSEKRDNHSANNWTILKMAIIGRILAGVPLSSVFGLTPFLLWLAVASNGLLGATPSQGSVELSTTPEGAEYSLVCEKAGISKKGKTPEIVGGCPQGPIG